jgi:hypothetical protein
MINSSISKKTLNEVDKIIQSYKEDILRDINKTFTLNLDNKVIIDMFLERKKNIINYKKKPDIIYNNCMARVWVKKYGYFQCNRKRKYSESEFCETHCNHLNYGRIDKKIIMD